MQVCVVSTNGDFLSFPATSPPWVLSERLSPEVAEEALQVV